MEQDLQVPLGETIMKSGSLSMMRMTFGAVVAGMTMMMSPCGLVVVHGPGTNWMDGP